MPDAKKSFLFVTWEGGGNVPPVLGLVKSLVARGHAVRVLAEPCIEHAVLATGAEYVAFERYFTRTDPSIDLIKDSKAPPLSIPAVENILVGPSLSVAHETIALLKDCTPDVLVADFMMPGSLFAAEAMGVKRVALFHMPEYLPGPGRPPGGMGLLPMKSRFGSIRDVLLEKVFNRVLNQYLPKANATRQHLGLPPLDNLADVFHQADLRLIQTCKAFDAPIMPAPKNVRYVGPVLDDPSWVKCPQLFGSQNDDRPLIVVSLSSTYQNQRSALEQIIRALSNIEARVLITLGPAMANEGFESADNITLVHSVPHSQVFPFADMVVTHAGHGTVMRSLAHGLPLVCMPMGRDQIDNAALLARHGAGIKLSPNANQKKIRKAVLRMLSDSSFKKNAEALKQFVIDEAKATVAEENLELLAGV